MECASITLSSKNDFQLHDVRPLKSTQSACWIRIAIEPLASNDTNLIGSRTEAQFGWELACNTDSDTCSLLKLTPS